MKVGDTVRLVRDERVEHGVKLPKGSCYTVTQVWAGDNLPEVQLNGRFVVPLGSVALDDDGFPFHDR